MATTVHVKNIGGKASDEEISNFFQFCGKISSIEITSEGTGEHATKNATVTFELPTAASTALLLNHTTLGGNEIAVTGSAPADATPSSRDPHRQDSPHLSQEEKPRARILAEILAHGYVVADQGLQKAIQLDEQHNISSRFVATLKHLDAKTGATDRALAADANYHISARASSLLTGLSSYFERKSRDTEAGRRLVAFYTNSQKQVQDIHAEARRLAELKKEQEGGGKFYKGLGLDKVLGSVHPSFATAAAAAEKPTEGKKNDEVPGGAPAHAVAAESATTPAADAKAGAPEVIH
ncbi:uncharacterized protein THITE_2061075 [Thermothielavioides terrestris NRRL 8126]|uniref:RRM domain-containing protein n=1 Tax=Thermothielavioides terrestris (strain ATCC 38088 / NRRL 8126) TaxID=578455 RepID=G2QT43_THETT|nr:uncharacterized protein THITE_2061075 [Thermothielavioides terrestris NRRL 8126]AEO64369.1 hypothetical protein THITE_2061075 [Thermothielavioides terrestris NRRL 8126]